MQHLLKMVFRQSITRLQIVTDTIVLTVLIKWLPAVALHSSQQLSANHITATAQ